MNDLQIKGIVLYEVRRNFHFENRRIVLSNGWQVSVSWFKLPTSSQPYEVAVFNPAGDWRCDLIPGNDYHDEPVRGLTIDDVKSIVNIVAAV